jgi:CO/xanthine dehydrogenase FAD-binding subunit
VIPTAGGAPVSTASTVAAESRELVVARSEHDAVAAFGDGAGVTVIGGGTIVTPLVWHGRLRPERALLLAPPALGGLAVEGDTLTVGATVTLARLAEVALEPLASAARIPDPEIRGQATVGGNLHVAGDLQPALLVLGARVRSAGAAGERVEPIADYLGGLAGGEPRLVLSVEAERPLAGAYLVQRRRHSHTATILSVAAARRSDGVHVAVGGLAELAPAVACPSVERALAAGASAGEAAAAVVEDVRPEDDSLASAWYRQRVLAVLVARALGRLEEAR